MLTQEDYRMIKELHESGATPDRQNLVFDSMTHSRRLCGGGGVAMKNKLLFYNFFFFLEFFIPSSATLAMKSMYG